MERDSFLALLLAAAATLRAAEASDKAIQALATDESEPASLRAAVLEPAVTEVRPIEVMPFNNSAAFDQPPVRRRWQQPENELLGTPLVLRIACECAPQQA